MDAMHGLSEFDEGIRIVLDSPEIQRLRWIRQTGLAFLVFPGSEHSRFAHAFGAYTIARRAFERLRSLATQSGFLLPSDLDEQLERAFGVAALCHDIGHTAFSHALESRLLPNGFRRHEDCTLCLLGPDTPLAKRIYTTECDIEQVLQLFQRTHPVYGLCKLLSGQVDVDRWDYLLRDAHAAGVIYGIHDLDWIMHSLYLSKDADYRPQLVIDARRGVIPLQHYISARSSMYQQVYFHKVIRGAESLLRAIFECAIEREDPSRERQNEIPVGLRAVLRGSRPTVDDFLATDDVSVMAAIRCWASSASDPVLKYLSRCFLQRRLPKLVRSTRNGISESFVNKVCAAVEKAFGKEVVPDFARLTKSDFEKALGYLVLVDHPEYKSDNAFDGLWFDVGEGRPLPLEKLKGRPEFDVLMKSEGFRESRVYVPFDVYDAVSDALQKEPIS